MKNIRYQNKVIPYTVSKSKIKNLYITVQDGEVAVSAPWYVTSSQIQEILEEKREWIYRKLSEYNNSPRAAKKYVENERFHILGKSYYLHIEYLNIMQEKLVVDNEQIIVKIPNKLKNMDNKEIIKKLIEKMYYKIAEQEFEIAMDKTRIMTKLAPEEYKIKKLKRAWGNCSSERKINLNIDLVMYSKKAIEYVVLHEVCHLKYLSHSKKFWQMVESYMPDYKDAEAELKNRKVSELN